MTEPALAAERPAPPSPSGLAALIEQALQHLQDGETDQAIQTCERALGSRRDNPEALYVLGLINLDLEDPITALKLIEMAHERDPQVQEYAEMLAALYASLGNVNDSLFYAKLGTMLPAHPTISGLLPERFGTFFENLERGRSDLYLGHAERKAATQDFEGAIQDCQTQLELTPGEPETLRLLSLCCLRTGKLTRAAAALQSVLHADEARPEDFASLGDALGAMGRPATAFACHRMAVDQAPERPDLMSRAIAGQLTAPAADDRTIECLHQEWRTRFAETIAPRNLPPDLDDSPDRALRIAYISADFFDNDLMAMVEPVLHGHRPDQFEIYCYADGRRTDLVTERIQRVAAKWTEIDRIDDETLWQILRGDKIDIAVDLTGHGPNCRALMMARRPSPITLAWLGYLNPPGVPQIDYFLADAQSYPQDPPAQEAVWRLEQGICSYLAPPLIPDVTPLPARGEGRVSFGAQCDLRLVDPATAALWARILHALPSARLIISNACDQDEDAVERCLESFACFGLRDRVDVVNFAENFHTGFDFYQHIDIALDPPGFSAVNETCWALWMGVPVLTLAGRRYAQRRGASLLHAAGQPQWVFEAPEALVAGATALAGDLDALAARRESLRGDVTASRLGDPVGFTRQLEDAYRTMWRRWCAGDTRPPGASLG